MSTQMREGDKVSRSRRKFIDGLFEHAELCVLTTTEWNGNKSRSCAPSEIATEFWSDPEVYLRWHGSQRYTVHVHRNKWYEFNSFAPDSSRALQYAQRIVTRTN